MSIENDQAVFADLKKRSGCRACEVIFAFSVTL